MSSLSQTIAPEKPEFTIITLNFYLTATHSRWVFYGSIFMKKVDPVIELDFGRDKR